MQELKALEILEALAEDFEYNIEDNTKVLEAIEEIKLLQFNLKVIRDQILISAQIIKELSLSKEQQ